MRRRGFTLLELLVTLLLSTLLLLLLYQVFGKVAQDLLAVREGRDFALFLKASEGLRRQLEALDPAPVNLGGRKGALFSWHHGHLVFLTDFSLTGPVLVLYRNQDKGLLYAEIPYTGQRLPPNPWEAVQALPHPPIFFLPGMKLTLLKMDEDGPKELSSWRGIPKAQNHLVLRISAGPYQRDLPLCPKP